MDAIWIPQINVSSSAQCCRRRCLIPRGRVYLRRAYDPDGPDPRGEGYCTPCGSQAKQPEAQPNPTR